MGEKIVHRKKNKITYWVGVCVYIYIYHMALKNWPVCLVRLSVFITPNFFMQEKIISLTDQDNSLFVRHCHEKRIMCLVCLVRKLMSHRYVTRYIYFHWFSYEMVSETYIVIGDKKHLSCKKFVCTKKIVPRVKLSILSKTMCEKKIKNEKK
jgi:hypothetical protein